MTSHRSLNVVVSVPSAEAELASDVLWRLGAAAIEEREGPDGGVELRVALGEDRRSLRVLLRVLRWPWAFEETDPSVSDTWREFAEPTVIDERIVVYPAWCAPPTGPQDIRIAIEPGPTFGLGNHPSTVLCIRALREVLRVGDRVLDIGTGSGVLAIAAVKLGASESLGVDILPACAAVVATNAAHNGVGYQVAVTFEPLATQRTPFDIVLANILAPTLIELAPDLRRLAGRSLIVSGILAEESSDGRTADVVASLAPLTVQRELRLDGWAALILGR